MENIEPMKFSFEQLTEDFNELIMLIGQSEDEIEWMKIETLACREDFNIFEIFKLFFNSKDTGSVDIESLWVAFDQLGAQVEELEPILKRYAKDGNELSYGEYCWMMLPESKEHSELVTNRIMVNHAKLTSIEELGGNMYENLKQSLVQLFETMGERFSAIEIKKQKMMENNIIK